MMKTSAPEATRTRKRNNPGLAAEPSSASSRPANRHWRSKASTSNLVRRPWGEPLTQHDLDLIEKLIQTPNRKINLKDIPSIKSNTFENKSGILASGLFKPYKQQVTLRIDSDILAWVRRDGEGYQTRINAALRKAMLADLKRNGVTAC